MQEKYGASGLVVLGVNVDQRRPDAERFLAQVPAKFTIAYDPQGTAPKLYAIKGMPSSVLIDPQGRVLLTHAGFRDEERDELEAKIHAALPPRAN
jgi:cytochrome c biogenesis protein CcmG/thiol:disulfide interchange protein DsbE